VPPLATNTVCSKRTKTQTNEGLAAPVIKDKAAFFFSEKEFAASCQRQINLWLKRKTKKTIRQLADCFFDIKI